MKNWKQSTFFGFWAILVLILALVACNDDNGHKHDWEDWVIIKEPTTLKEGEKTHICKTCEETETVAIAKLPDPPKNQTADLENLFGEGLSTTVTTFLTDLEWYSIDYDEDDEDDLGVVANKIKVALNDAFNSGPTAPPPVASEFKQRFRNVFNATDGYNIKIAKPSEQDNWSKWKAEEEDRVARILLLGFNELDNNLQQTITSVITAINLNQPGKE